MQVVFRDTFKNRVELGDDWDVTVSMYGGKNDEFQVYTPHGKNIYIRDGCLFLRPTLTVDHPKFSHKDALNTATMDMHEMFDCCTEECNDGAHREGRYGTLPPIMSARISPKVSMKYGRITVVARIPRGDWIWPAIWLLPKDECYGGWPTGGEIDLMESRGNMKAMDADGVNHGCDTISSAVHFGVDPNQTRELVHDSRMSQGTWSDDFHSYSVQWTEDSIVHEVDGKESHVVKTPPDRFFKRFGFHGNDPWTKGGHNAPFDQNFKLFLQVAVGTNYGFFPDTWDYGYEKPWKNKGKTPNRDFWEKRHSWLPSWESEAVAMVIKEVKMETL